jgi:hypothetical protein
VAEALSLGGGDLVGHGPLVPTQRARRTTERIAQTSERR